MKRLCIYLMLYLVAATVGCTTSDISTEPVDVVPSGSRLPSSVLGTWRGVIPCADCPGINYNLSLNEDNTFEETMVYQERDVEPYTRSGTWRITNGVLQLAGPDTLLTQFDLSVAGELNMLDSQGKRINTPLADRYSLRRDTALPESNTSLWDEKRRLGVDFVATGNEPGWALEIDLEKGMYFRTLPSETIALDTPMPQPVKEGNATFYRGVVNGEELIVELLQQPCKDTMSGQMSPYLVRVTAKGIQFSGCGAYLNEKR